MVNALPTWSGSGRRWAPLVDEPRWAYWPGYDLHAMDHAHLIDQLERQGKLFAELFGGTDHEEQLHRAAPGKWCLLEAICHLRDEEQEDFRARVKHVLETPDLPMPKIDPQAWITDRRYVEQDFATVLKDFLAERGKSVTWLRSLGAPNWKSFYLHPKVGPISAEFLLANWVAHDIHHIRQVNACLLYTSRCV